MITILRWASPTSCYWLIKHHIILISILTIIITLILIKTKVTNYENNYYLVNSVQPLQSWTRHQSTARKSERGNPNKIIVFAMKLQYKCGHQLYMHVLLLRSLRGVTEFRKCSTIQWGFYKEQCIAKWGLSPGRWVDWKIWCSAVTCTYQSFNVRPGNATFKYVAACV